MKFYNTEIEGVKIIVNNRFNDKRGDFFKIFNDNIFKDNGIDLGIKECYYTISKKDVIRGMHFQAPPFEHDKLVSVGKGSILDVVVDIRKKSPTYKKYISVELSESNGKILLIPKGCAHGYLSLVDNSMVIYCVSTVHSPENDLGIRYDSFGMNWNVSNPIISEKDMKLRSIDEVDVF